MKQISLIYLTWVILLSLPDLCFAQQWILKNPINSIHQMMVSDDEVYLIGSEAADTITTGAVTKYNFTGIKQYNHLIGDTSFGANTIIKSIDSLKGTSDVLIVAVTMPFNGENNTTVARIDSSGNIVWRTNAPACDYFSEAFVDASSFPDMIITLSTNEDALLEYNLWDTMGNHLARKPLNLSVMFSSIFVRKTFSKCADGFFVFYELSPTVYNGIAKVGFDGNIKWTNTYEWHRNIYPVPVDLKDGRTVLFYGAGDFVQYDILSAQGAITKTDTIPLNAYQLEDVQLKENGFLLCGSLDSGNINKYWGDPTHAFIARIDSNYQNTEIYEIPQITLLRQFNTIGNRFIGFGESGEDQYVFSDSMFFSPYLYNKVAEVEKHNLSDLAAFPNPAKNTVTIRSPFKKEHTIAIYDVTGVLRYKSEGFDSPEFQIPLEGLNPGMYMLINYDEDGHTARAKLIIEQ